MKAFGGNVAYRFAEAEASAIVIATELKAASWLFEVATGVSADTSRLLDALDENNLLSQSMHQ